MASVRCRVCGECQVSIAFEGACSCRACGQQHEWIEGRCRILLSDAQKTLLKGHAEKKACPRTMSPAAKCGTCGHWDLYWVAGQLGHRCRFAIEQSHGAAYVSWSINPERAACAEYVEQGRLPAWDYEDGNYRPAGPGRRVFDRGIAEKQARQAAYERSQDTFRARKEALQASQESTERGVQDVEQKLDDWEPSAGGDSPGKSCGTCMDRQSVVGQCYAKPGRPEVKETDPACPQWEGFGPKP